MRTVGLYTLGCKVSQYETEAVSEEFSRRGYTVLDFGEVCDAYVINTCTVTAESDRKCRQIIRRALGRAPGAVVAVIGCYSQRAPKELLAISGVDIVIGTADKLSVVDRVEEHLNGACLGASVSVSDLSGAEFEPMTVHSAPRTRAYVKIEDGCEARCSYCAISAARGRVRSKPVGDVIREVEVLYASGTREIVLTGIETGSYGRDLDGECDLASLICELDARGSCERIRLGSLAPELCGESFARRVSGARILAPHFHISMQSGSDSVLRAMRRRYTSAGAVENIERLRTLIPGAQFTTDLMVGFPGESEEDFLKTVELVRSVRFIGVHVFAYSRRAGTSAADFPNQIDEATKRRRSRRLIEVSRKVRDEVLDEVIRDRKELRCILEAGERGVFTAHSDEFFELEVAAPSRVSGDCVIVRPVSHKNGIIRCELV